MSRWLKGLNPEQRRAVEAVEGPLLVLAGAGSGKTRVITHRVAHMIASGVGPESILAVTFTNKAAAEMRARLQSMVGRAASGVIMSTFHSLGLMMLREERRRRRRNARFVVYDQGDQIACLRDLLRRVRPGASLDLVSLLARISAFKNRFLSAGDLPASDDPYDSAAAALYPLYTEALDSFAAVDFDDLICEPTRMMERSRECRQRWSARFCYVLVDEYQDSNAAQLRMLRALAGEHRNLCVVGDDDQSIYGWRGAEVQNILRFEQHFPGCQVIRLERNYRSVGSVLALANEVIAANTARHPKRLLPTREKGQPVRLVVLEDGEAEAAFVADSIREALDPGRRAPADVAVLYRSNSLARALESALRERRIAYRVVGGKSFFDRKEVKDLLAYLRLAVNPADAISLRRVINYPHRGIGAATVARLASWAEQRGQSLWQAAESAQAALDDARSAAAVTAFVELVRRARKRLGRGDLAAGARELVDEIGLHDEIAAGCRSGKAIEMRWGAVCELVDGLQAYTERATRPTLREFLGQVSLLELDADASEDGSAEGRVTLSTLHGAKGLEFGLVFLVGMEEGLLPHERVVHPRIDEAGQADLAEERRLCYVGVTRARDELVLTRAARRTHRGRGRERAPSRFIAGLPDGLLAVEDRTEPLGEDQARERLARIRAMLEDE
ncbi:MAG: UvrD-helicase domain-containing protein [Deltaproteobacteria bacterium]|nr:UvrD-helicase domain-containing protein [Deltaproteobacteria bacterium]